MMLLGNALLKEKFTCNSLTATMEPLVVMLKMQLALSYELLHFAILLYYVLCTNQSVHLFTSFYWIAHFVHLSVLFRHLSSQSFFSGCYQLSRAGSSSLHSLPVDFKSWLVHVLQLRRKSKFAAGGVCVYVWFFLFLTFTMKNGVWSLQAVCVALDFEDNGLIYRKVCVEMSNSWQQHWTGIKKTSKFVKEM